MNAVASRIATNLTPTKSAWLEERRTYIGATDAGAICGVNPYVSPHDVWLDKMGLRSVDENIAMRHGIYVESFIAREYQNATGRKVLKSKLYRHKRFEQFACNPDREVIIEGRRGLVECKSVGHFASKNFGQDGSDQIPEHYMVQVLWQLLVTGYDFCHLAALVDNRELRVFTYTLNPELSHIAHVFPEQMAKDVFAACGSFWERYIKAEIEPPMSGHDSDTQYLQGLRQADTYENGKMTNTDVETDRECRLLPKAIKREKRAKLVAAERKNRIRKFMAERNATTLESSVGNFTWKVNARGTAVFNTPFRGENA